MGLNTAAIILNDQCSDLRQPGAGEHIYRAMMNTRQDGWTPVGVTVLKSQHADTVQIVAVGGNRIFTLGYGHWTHEPEELLKQLADQMGFRIVRKPTPKDHPNDR